ncbi:MAG: hypothetical protein R6V05_05170, partial [Candidatus Brocadiia bacterium]
MDEGEEADVPLFVPQYAPGVLGHLLVEAGGGLIPREANRPHRADGHAFAAAYAQILIHVSHLIHLDGVLGAPLGAGAARDALLFPDFGAPGGVLAQLARARCQPHGHVLDGAA